MDWRITKGIRIRDRVRLINARPYDVDVFRYWLRFNAPNTIYGSTHLSSFNLK